MTEPQPPWNVRNFTEPNGRRWTLGVSWELVRGRYEPVRVEVRSHGEPISASALRRLPLGEIIAKARRDLRKLASDSVDRATTEEGRRQAKSHAAKYGPHRGVQVSHDELERVAAAYRTAYHSAKPVTAAVAEACHVSASTAGKRIMAARAAGLLDGIGGRS